MLAPMIRTPRILLVTALVAGVIAVFAVVVWRRRKDVQTAPDVALAVVKRLEAAKKPERAALVASACKKDICACAGVAGRNGLDIDAHLEVLEVLAAAGASCPDNKETGGLHAEAVARLGDNDRATKEATQVLAQDPNNPFGLYAMSLVDYRMARPAQAMTQVSRAIDAGRGATAHLLAGLIASNQNDLEGAARHFRAMLKTDPDDLDGLFNLAMVAQRSKHYTEARESFLRVANLDPTHKNARYHLAILAHSIGADDEANHHMAKFESLAPGDKRIGELKTLLGSKPATAPPQAPRLNDGVVVTASPASSSGRTTLR